MPFRLPGRCRTLLTPPGQVTLKDVRWFEATAGNKAFGQAHGHADWPANLIPGSQPHQHAPTTILGGSGVAHPHDPGLVEGALGGMC